MQNPTDQAEALPKYDWEAFTKGLTVRILDHHLLGIESSLLENNEKIVEHRDNEVSPYLTPLL
jgi:hypothetical protein